MPLKFREDKATQAAGWLIDRSGGQVNYTKLIKLLYIAERTAILRYGRPITFDSYFSMDHGPVLSFVYDRIKTAPTPGENQYWHQYISPHQDYDVVLTKETPTDQLSEAEIRILAEVFEDFGQMDWNQLCKYTHTLPEWQHPQGSTMPIEVFDILSAEGWSKEDAEELIEVLEAESIADEILG